MSKRLKLSLKRDEALSATRVSIGPKKKLVYVLITNKLFKYPNGKSRIAYIGTTQKGVTRIAQSVASRAQEILEKPGVRKFHARVITCNPRQNVSSWKKLERALLIGFKEHFGSIPRCNKQGKNFKIKDEFEYFAHKRIIEIIKELS